MAKPTIEVLGVYALPLTCREQLQSVVLVEALVRGRDKQFKVSDFCQAEDGVPRDNWQVAYDERYLTVDGGSLLAVRWPDLPKAKDFRIAFFIHYWKPSKPLSTSYGELNCPAAKKMPERLRELVPYEPVD